MLLDFDGPVCSLFARTPDHVVSAGLRALLAERGVAVPAPQAAARDPFELLRFAFAQSEGHAGVVEAALTAAEVAAAGTAPLTAELRTALAAWRAAGRAVAVVSNNSAAAVEACLARHGLSPFVAAVAGRAGPDPARLKPSPEPVLRALRALGAEPAESLMVGDSPFDIAAARAAGVPAVGYVCRPGLRERLLAAGAMATVETLAELAI